MTLELSPDEVEVLRVVLEQYLPILREEVHDTENYDMRQMLKLRADILNRLVLRLGGSPNENQEELRPYF